RSTDSWSKAWSPSDLHVTRAGEPRRGSPANVLQPPRHVMRRTLRLLVLTLATLAASASFAHAGPGALALKPGSKLWLTGTSPLHEFSSNASNLEVAFQQAPARWSAAATGGDAVESMNRAR